jgi:UDP-GlcNAc3NAcA epimerase
MFDASIDMAHPRNSLLATGKFCSPKQAMTTRTKKIVTVVGARPQFIKAAPLSHALAELVIDRAEDKRIAEVVVHTGQHYDSNMSESICNQLGLTPDENLGINGGSHGEQTAAMIRELEKVFIREEADLVLLYGDTNSTLAGALAAAKLGMVIAHVEAGLRSFNRAMPEEINRVVTDHLANILFAPTETAVRNLVQEGIKENVFLVGDVMYDAVQQNLVRARKESRILERLGLHSGSYVLATIHRAENTAGRDHLHRIVSALRKVAASRQVIWPMHPRTKNALDQAKIVVNDSLDRLTVIEPLPYLDMLMLESNAQVVVTDSGGVQKEAAWLGVPCVTVRKETEWVETVESGWNVLAGTDIDVIVGAISNAEERKRKLVPLSVRPGAVHSVASYLLNWLM